ncbi:hypothetical protein [Cellulomonas cellasea]|uniref:Membrane lipoprotein n=1 Tax=Cellulomonas cellasea DSM 20118 TaxID=1408250 RepID=A0A0A0B9X2_9CELL|nr:hypothetical protein [Cellulomonas cellasea]KGM02076.1 hypothetical protein Q760_15615 [Cellulomonas cellasea DSM 20118]
MTRTRRAALVVVPAVLVLGACAGRAGAGEPAVPAVPAAPAEIAAWSEPAGIAPELVHVTDVEGFTLATQSVGVVGDDGMSAAWVRGDGTGTVLLTTSRDAPASVVPCAGLTDAADAVLRCGVERGDVHVVLDGDGVDAATLRAAGEAVRVPGADELGALFADVQVPGPPVERGDLPPHGDGAPVDPPAVGG